MNTGIAYQIKQDDNRGMRKEGRCLSGKVN